MNYLPRIAEKTLHHYLNAFPVIGITGPRQSGKSTLLLHALPQYEYVTFDDPSNIEFFISDPKGFLRRYQEYTIFDEVQHVPELFNYIKMAVDQNRSQYGNYILTGSSQFSAMKRISESLAGRIGLLSLLPLQYAELPENLNFSAIYNGSYPELVQRSYEYHELWYSAYLDTYLTKDVRTLTNIGDMHDFQRFISLLAANTSQLLDMSNFARDLGVSVPTIKRWISILEASYIIFLLPPFYENFGKRIVKRPKIYFWDTGLVAYLTGIRSQELYEKGPMAGSLFENYVIADIYKKQLHLKTNNELFFLRTQDKLEIDLIIDKKQTKEFLEVKKSASFKPKMISAIKKVLTSEDKGYLLFQGNSQKYAENLWAKYYREFLKDVE